jgi:hypothetical protein
LTRLNRKQSLMTTAMNHGVCLLLLSQLTVQCRDNMTRVRYTIQRRVF